MKNQEEEAIVEKDLDQKIVDMEEDLNQEEVVIEGVIAEKDGMKNLGIDQIQDSEME